MLSGLRRRGDIDLAHANRFIKRDDLRHLDHFVFPVEDNIPGRHTALEIFGIYSQCDFAIEIKPAGSCIRSVNDIALSCEAAYYLIIHSFGNCDNLISIASYF